MEIGNSMIKDTYGEVLNGQETYVHDSRSRIRRRSKLTLC